MESLDLPNAPPESLLGELEARLRFETLFADLASRFVNLPIDEVETEIERAQRQVCALLGFDRSTFWRLTTPDRPDFQLVGMVQPEKVPQMPARMDARAHFPWTVERMLRGEVTLLTTLDDLPAEAARDRETFEYFATRSSGIFPVRVGGQILAVLTFASTSTVRGWPTAMVARLALVAQVFGSALNRKVAEEALRESQAALRDVSGRLIHAQEQERSWLAKELHDGLSQHLAMLAVELDLLGRRVPVDPERIRETLEMLSTRTRALSGEVHRLSHGLHPAKLDQLGLVAAMGGFCRELEAGEGLAIRFTARDVPGHLPREVALCLYRVAQEALWNVIKHSGAGGATVVLTGSAGEVGLTITDTGRGFDATLPPSSTSLGLIGMRERVGLVRGEILWESAPGKGTTVRVRVPSQPSGDA